MMEGVVTWPYLLAVLGVVQLVATALTSGLIYYFSNRSKDMDKVREIISSAMTDIETREAQRHAGIIQEHATLHERINRTNKKIPEAERALRGEFSAMMDKVEARLSKRVDDVIAEMRANTSDIIKAVRECPANARKV